MALPSEDNSAGRAQSQPYLKIEGQVSTISRLVTETVELSALLKKQNQQVFRTVSEMNEAIIILERYLEYQVNS